MSDIQLDLKGKTPDTPATPATPSVNKGGDKTMPRNEITTQGCDDNCVGKAYVFISAVPGSTVVINGTKADGLKRDVFSITFSPVGERKAHPIILGSLYTDFGMYATDDPVIASVLMRSIEKGNAQFFQYCEDNPSHAQFDPKVYAIETPQPIG